MKHNKMFGSFGCLMLGALFIFQGCATSKLKMPENLPPIIKTHKHFVVYGGRAGLRETGLYLNKGDVYSIFATGGINMCPNSNSCMHNSARPARPDHFLVGKIGKDKFLGGSGGMNVNGDILESYYAGSLYLGYRAIYPDDDKGTFNVDIIVWEKKDYGAIYDFYEEMGLINPNEKILEYALYRVKIRQKFAQTSTQIEATKKEIEALKEELASPEKGGPTDRERSENKAGEDIGTIVTDKTVTSLEATGKQSIMDQLKIKLEALEEQKAELAEMKKRFEEEKKKSAALSKKLEEGKKKEEQLLTRLKQGSEDPPVVVIAYPEDNSWLQVNAIRINGVAEDENGIQRIEIYINDQPIELRNTRGMRITPGEAHSRWEFKEWIGLRTGENTVRVVAEDTIGLATEKTLTLHYTERRKKIWSVIVGIDQYPNVPHLKYAVNDAMAMYDHLLSFNQVPAENITLLLNEDASLTRLRSALGTHLKKSAGQDDMVIIFFAGHGATEKDAMSPDGDGLEKYLLPFDADPKDLYATALPMGEISRIFNRISSERLVFIADSCYSGASGGRTIGIDGIRASLSDTFFDRLTSGKGRVIISASGANEVSAESEELQQGVFTYYLLEGLKGKADIDKDNLVTLDEAYRFVSEHVPRVTGQEQHPVKKGTVEGRFVLSVVP